MCCCMLSACHRNEEPAQTPVVASKQGAKSSVSTAVADPLAGMVKAVTADGQHQTIKLRFEFATRPQVGEALDVKLNLLGVDDATDVKLVATADPKLAIVSGGDAGFASIKAGESVAHTLIVRGTQTGIFVVDAKLTATANGGPRTMNYSIPVAIVPAASAVADAVPAAAPAKK